MDPSASILVVDDNRDNRALADATLTDEGDRVVLDVRMPGAAFCGWIHHGD